MRARQPPLSPSNIAAAAWALVKRLIIPGRASIGIATAALGNAGVPVEPTSPMAGLRNVSSTYGAGPLLTTQSVANTGASGALINFGSSTAASSAGLFHNLASSDVAFNQTRASKAGRA